MPEAGKIAKADYSLSEKNISLFQMEYKNERFSTMSNILKIKKNG